MRHGFEPSSTEIRIYFRLAEPNEIEYAAEVITISMDSFLMSSPVRLPLGTKLQLRMRVPVEISGSPFVELRTAGRVVAFTPSERGEHNYNVKIEGSLHASPSARRESVLRLC